MKKINEKREVEGSYKRFWKIDWEFLGYTGTTTIDLVEDSERVVGKRLSDSLISKMICSHAKFLAEDIFEDLIQDELRWVCTQDEEKTETFYLYDEETDTWFIKN